MPTDALTILVIADPHYVNHAGRECTVPSRMGRFGLEWIERAMEQACRVCPPDVVVLMGDLVDDGAAEGARQDIARLAQTVNATGIPIVVVPGNHDCDATELLQTFGDETGPHHFKGYVLYSFADPYGPGDICTRPQVAIDRFVKETAGQTVVALQHSPLYPPVDCSRYPYMPTNTGAIMSAYESSGAVLSLSGHYHKGTGPAQCNGVTYLTAAALCEPPFPFYVAQIRGGEVKIGRFELKMPSGVQLIDCHTHTHFGYCAVDMHPETSRERARVLGLAGIACVEHAGQLYLSPREFWSKRHVDEPRAIAKARKKETDRMGAYRVAMSRYRSPSLHVGLEVECDRDGKLTLLDEDREDWDVILGAVHWFPSGLSVRTSARRVATLMRLLEQLVPQGIDILAHPFRILGPERPDEVKALYEPVAALLAEHSVAAELNFHYNEPDAEFFLRCAEQGVRIALGSDAHYVKEVGHLLSHLRLLQGIGVSLHETATVCRPKDPLC